MTGVDFLILFGLCFVLFPCEGTISLPPDGNRLVFKLESTAEIKWSFSDNIDTVDTRRWTFTSSDGSGTKLIGKINKDNDPEIETPWLQRAKIQKPATLILNNVDRSLNGTYEFTLLTPGTAVSVVAVFIAEQPLVTVNCSHITTVKKGDNVACLCKGEGGNPEPASVTWYDNGRNKIGGAGKREEVLKLSNVDKTDKGKYICVARSHELAENETSIELIVNFPPENVLTVFSSETAERGKQFTITCSAEAFPQPTFKIFYNETKLLINRDTYTISNVNDGHSGFYHCVAENDLDSVNSTSRYLSVGNVGQSSTTFPTSKTNLGNKTVETETSGSDGLSGGAIAGIVIGVLVVVVIVAGVIYWFKFKPNGKDHGPKKDTEEKAKKKRGDENVYDAVNMDDKASGSRSSHELESPMNYAVLDKNALNTGAPKKPERDAEESTAYASIDVGKVGQVEADLV